MTTEQSKAASLPTAMPPPPRPGGTWFVARGDRLAARLKHTLFAWRFVRQVGGTLVVGWPQRARSLYGTMAGEYYSPSLLFDLPRFYLEHGTSDILFVEGDGLAAFDVPRWPPPELAAQLPNALDRSWFASPRGPFKSDNYVVQFADETRAQVQDQLRALFRLLPLSAAAGKLLDDVGRVVPADGYAALHVRRGDVVAVLRAALPEMLDGRLTFTAQQYAIHLAKQTAPLDFYYDRVEQAAADGLPILFFSDNPELFAIVRAKFRRVRIVDASRLARNAAHPLLKAFVDFTLIGRAERVIGTQTGFASVAAMLGGARPVVITARGSWDDFCRYMYDDVLGSAALPATVRDQIEAAVHPEYMRYYQRSVRRQENIS